MMRIRLVWCLLASFLVYLPIVTKGFAADDFSVLLRITSNGEFFTADFFRPVSDISIYLCYLVGGMNAWVYNLFNILVHGVNVYLLYLTTSTLLTKEHQVVNIASVAALLFLVYPFHNEGIVWIVGRGASLSTLFASAALLIALKYRFSISSSLCAGVLFFISLSTYETGILLPVIVFACTYFVRRSLRESSAWLATLSVFGGLNVLLRTVLNEAVVGSYGERMFNKNVLDFAVGMSKAVGRFFLPPAANAGVMVLLTLAVVGLLVLAIWILFKKSTTREVTLLLLFCVAVAALVPILFGVSTRTIEGDRVVYFTSFFLCLLLAYLLLNIFSGTIASLGVIGISTYFLVCLQLNNFTWIKASAITHELLGNVADINKSCKRLILLNVPEEYKGAHVFRNGLIAALSLRGVDTSSIRLVGFQGQSVLVDSLDVALLPVQMDVRRRRIGLQAVVDTMQHSIDVSSSAGQHLQLLYEPTDCIAYWNHFRMSLLK